MKLILIPLIFMFILTVLAQMGLGQSFTVGGTIDFETGDGYYTSASNLDQYQRRVLDNNGTIVVADSGAYTSSFGQNHYAYFHNSSGRYPLFHKTSSSNTYAFLTNGSTGWLAVVGIMIAVAAVAGFKIFSSGLSEMSVSTILKGGAFLSIFMALSVLSYPIFGMLPLGFGLALYGFLSMLYTLGVINQFGHPGGE